MKSSFIRNLTVLIFLTLLFTLLNVYVAAAKAKSTISIAVRTDSPQPLGTRFWFTITISPPVSTTITLTFTKPDGTVYVTTGAEPRTGFEVYDFYYTPDMVGNWTVIASWPGNDQLEGAVSEPATFRVIPAKLPSSFSDIKLSSDRITIGDSITVSGRLNPPISGARITLMFAPITAGRSNEFRYTLTDENGSFSFTFKPMYTGEWKVYVSWEGNENYAAASASGVPFFVEERKLPVMEIAIGGVAAAVLVIFFLLRRRRT